MRVGGTRKLWGDFTHGEPDLLTAWTTARTTAGVSCRFHDLRHTVVTRLLESVQPFGVIPDIMGWSPGTTVRMIKRYGHIGSVARRTAMAALEAAG